MVLFSCSPSRFVFPLAFVFLNRTGYCLCQQGTMAKAISGELVFLQFPNSYYLYIFEE